MCVVLCELPLYNSETDVEPVGKFTNPKQADPFSILSIIVNSVASAASSKNTVTSNVGYSFHVSYTHQRAHET